MELWYWHHSYLVTPQAVQSSKVLIDQAARAGYTGVALWDSSWTFMSEPGWPSDNISKLKEVVDYAASRGLRVMPTVVPYGHSNDVLKQNPNWAEGQRVVGTRFQVDGASRMLRQVKSLHEASNLAPGPLLNAKFQLTPWRQYHIHLAVRTRSFRGLAQLEVSDGAANRLDVNLQPRVDEEWTALDYTFNSAESSALRIQAGIFGPHSGELEVGQFLIEETALVYVLRRAGTPLRVYDPEHPERQFVEGRDFLHVDDAKLLRSPEFAGDNFHDPGPVTLPPGTTLRPGQTVAMDYYAVTPVYGEAVSACLTDPAVERWMVRNAQAAAALLPQKSGLFLSHDEIRQMNSCALCRARNLSAGGLLARHIGGLTEQLSLLGPLYIWSDMFDPGHNAHDHFYQVEGSLAGSWKGLDSQVTVMNWNLDHLHNSLVWFSGDDPRQPVPHRQIIAGFYDPASHDAAAEVRREWAQARGVPGIAGAMYTTWTDDYTQLEAFAQAAHEEWKIYRDSRPW